MHGRSEKRAIDSSLSACARMLSLFVCLLPGAPRCPCERRAGERAARKESHPPVGLYSNNRELRPRLELARRRRDDTRAQLAEAQRELAEAQAGVNATTQEIQATINNQMPPHSSVWMVSARVSIPPGGASCRPTHAHTQSVTGGAERARAV